LACSVIESLLLEILPWRLDWQIARPEDYRNRRCTVTRFTRMATGVFSVDSLIRGTLMSPGNALSKGKRLYETDPNV